MPRVGLTSVDVVASAAELADEVGYGSLTMGLLADRLGVRGQAAEAVAEAEHVGHAVAVG